MSVPGFQPAVVVPPRGKGPRPVVVLLHSSADRPQWMCRHWAPTIAGRGWMVCTRGTLRQDVAREQDRWTYGSPPQALAEIRAALERLRQEYPDRVAAGPVMLVGFSKGAYLATHFAKKHPREFSWVFAHEGGGSWSAGAARQFAAQGGRALAITCGRPRCSRRARRNCQRARKGGVTCLERFFPGLGHSCELPFGKLAASIFERLVRGEEQWQKK